MSSRTEEKQRLRAEREAKERERAHAARRRRRLQLLGAVLAAAGLIVAVAIAAGGGGGSGGGSGKQIQGGGAVNGRFGGIPQQGVALGNPNAPVTFVEFADLKCPFCREYTLTVFPTLVDRYVRTGKVRMVMQLQHFVGNQNGDSEHAARMALAAAQQNKLWQFADLFYINQKDETTTYANDVFLRRIAEQVNGLNVAQAFAARNSPAITQELDQASRSFSTAGFSATPSFAVGKTGGTLRPLNVSALDVSQFSRPIDSLLGK